MRTDRTGKVVFTLCLMGWMAFFSFQGASAVPMPTAAPQQAKAWFNADTTQNWDDADDVQAVTEASSGEESQDEAPADEGAKDEDAAEDQTDDADASSSGDWDSGSSGVVKNRTSSEQLIVSDAEKKLQAALHTEVFNPDLSIEASLGYSGIITYTKPVPVEVTLKNSGGDLDGRVCVNLYRTNSVYDRVEYPLYLPAGAEKRIRFYVTLAMKQDIFTVEYRWGDQTVASVNVSPFKTVPPNYCLVGVLSSSPGALNYLNIDSKNDRLLRGEYFQTVPLSVNSFPDTLDALDAFGMLAVDGVDLTSLSEPQKAAFDAWLKAGGVVIVGGGAQAATDYPFFEPYTGVQAGALYQAEDITLQLLLSVGETGEALGQGALLNRIEVSERTIAQTAEYGLVNQYRADGGAVFLSAFELGARPLTDWSGIGTLWQRIILKNAPDAYTGILSGYGSAYRDNEYRASSILSSMPVENTNMPRALVIWLLSGFVAVSGILMYLIMKKLDRRDWLWITMPACALIAAFLVFRIGATGDAIKPIETSYVWAILNAQGGSSMTVGVGAATPSRNAVRLSVGSELTLTPTERNEFEDNYYDNATFLKTPSRLRYVRTLGRENSVTLPAQAAWTMNALTATDSRAFEGHVPAAIWMEDDGLHGRVKNDTPYPLTDCAVICSAGFADLGDLAPGQETTFQILKLTDEEAAQLKASKNSDDYDFAPEGRIIGTSPDGTPGSVDVSVIYNAAIIKEYRIPDQNARSEAYKKMSGLERAVRSARQDLISMCMEKWAYNGGWYGGASDMFFRFCGFSDQLGAVQLTIDGEPVTRKAHTAVVDAEITYQPVGPTGLMCYPIGEIPPHEADATTGVPVMGKVAANDRSFRVNSSPVFGFLIPDANKMEGLALTLQSRYYDQSPTVALYNAQTGGWDDMTAAFIALKGEKLAPYLGADGALFVRYSPGVKSDSYQEIATPVISVSGRVRK